MQVPNSAWPQSLWCATAEPFQHCPGLQGNHDCDVLIIGAGFTGLSTALHLSKRQRNITVLDAAQPGWGCSGRNGGQVNPGWKPSLARIRELYPNDSFAGFIRVINESADLVFDLIDQYQIRCEARRVGSLIATRGQSGVEYVSNWGKFWQQFGAPVEVLDAGKSRELVGHGAYDASLFDRRGGTVQPLSYARGLAQACINSGVALYGDSAASAVTRSGSEWLVKTAQAEVKCRQLVIATNGYTDSLWPGLAQSIVPVASMLTATEPLNEYTASQIVPGRQAVAEYSGVPPYYRVDENNRLIFGWRGTVSGAIGSLDTRHLRAKALDFYPQLKDVKWEYDWAGYVGITSHQRPMLIHLDDNAWAGLGYNGRGITMASMMGKQLAQAIFDEPVDLPVERLKPIPLHDFYRIGVTARILWGHFRDSFTTPVT